MSVRPSIPNRDISFDLALVNLVQFKVNHQGSTLFFKNSDLDILTSIKTLTLDADRLDYEKLWQGDIKLTRLCFRYEGRI